MKIVFKKKTRIKKEEIKDNHQNDIKHDVEHKPIDVKPQVFS